MKIICIGRNYIDHAKELNNPVPERPLIFMKPPSALLVNDKPFYHPDFSSEIHYEVEIVLKIGKNGRHIQPAFAAQYYKEVAVGIDFTARDLQSELKKKGHPWEIAKGFDNSAALSKFIPTDELNMDNIKFGLKLNGEWVQQGETKDLIFSFDRLMQDISVYFKLQLGDLIYTGTPKGVGKINIGDRLEAYIEDRKMLHCEVR